MPAAARTLRTPAQNNRTWSLVANLGRLSGLGREQIEADILRPLVRRISGQEHTSRLSTGQANQVIEALEKEVASYKPRRREAGPEPAPHRPWGPRGEEPREDAAITPFQQVVLDGLYQLVGYDRQRQITFSQRQCKKPWPQSQEDADKIIEPLKSMAMRKVDGAEISARVSALVGRPELNAWQVGFVADMVRQFADAGTSPKTALSPHKLLKILEAEARCPART